MYTVPCLIMQGKVWLHNSSSLTIENLKQAHYSIEMLSLTAAKKSVQHKVLLSAWWKAASLTFMGHKKIHLELRRLLLEKSLMCSQVFFSSEVFYQIVIKDNRVSKSKSTCQMTLTSISFAFPLGKTDWTFITSYILWKGLRWLRSHPCFPFEHCREKAPTVNSHLHFLCFHATWQF